MKIINGIVWIIKTMLKVFASMFILMLNGEVCGYYVDINVLCY